MSSSPPITRASNTQVATSASSERFPMIEWVAIAPSQMFWKLNVDLTFVASKEAVAKIVADSADAVGRFVIVTFQSQSASLARDAKAAMEQEEEQQEKQHKEEGQQKQLSKGDTYMYSEGVTEWKDLCRENVLAFARHLRSRLNSLAPNPSGNSSCWWFDAVDPATGQPLDTTPGPSLYSESDAIEQLLRLPVVSVGVGNSVCRLVQHPKHGLDVYPASMFFVGPRDLLVEALKF